MEVRESWLWLVAILAVISVAASVDDKCAACNAIAGELELSIANERPRNHLDMRHRLDPKGQRQGKVIDYKVSELRAVELLDRLCEKMQDYTLMKTGSSTRTWVKIDDWDSLTNNKQEARAHSKDISSYCGRLLEETEDEVSPLFLEIGRLKLTELIKKGAIGKGHVSRVLCGDLSKHCSKSSYESDADKYDDDEEEEEDQRSDGEL